MLVIYWLTYYDPIRGFSTESLLDKVRFVLCGYLLYDTKMKPELSSAQVFIVPLAA
jgi:hypothetical protein